MKRFSLPLCLVLLLGMATLHGCQQKTEEKSPTPEELQAQKQDQAWERAPFLVKEVLKSAKGDARGYVWGQALSEIKEPLDLSELQPNQGISYTLFLDDSDLNFVDIGYHANAQGQLEGLVMDIFLAQRAQVNELKAGLEAYFDTLIGVAKKSQGGMVWENKKTRITLVDVSTSKDPGLKLEFQSLILSKSSGEGRASSPSESR